MDSLKLAKYHIRIQKGGSRVTYAGKGSGAKMSKQETVKRFFEELARRYPDIDTYFKLFVREKAPPGSDDDPGTFAFARRQGQAYPILPDYVAMKESTISMLRLDGNSLRSVPWNSRKPEAVWRGSNDAGGWRAKMATLSRGNRDILNAKIVGGTKLSQAHPIPGGLQGERMTMAQQVQYRFIVNSESWTGIVWKMLAGSVLLELMDEDLPYHSWHHDLLEPYEHYVPCTTDTLIDQIEWCRENDERCQQIAARGRKLAKEWFSYSGALRFAYDRLRDTGSGPVR